MDRDQAESDKIQAILAIVFTSTIKVLQYKLPGCINQKNLYDERIQAHSDKKIAIFFKPWSFYNTLMG